MNSWPDPPCRIGLVDPENTVHEEEREVSSSRAHRAGERWRLPAGKWACGLYYYTAALNCPCGRAGGQLVLAPVATADPDGVPCRSICNASTGCSSTRRLSCSPGCAWVNEAAAFGASQDLGGSVGQQLPAGISRIPRPIR